MTRHFSARGVNYFSSMLSSLEERTALTKTPQSPFPFTIKTLDVDLPNLKEKDVEKYLPQSEREKEETLNEDEQELMQSIKENPFLTNTDRALGLGWHRSRYSQNRKSLRRKELIEEISFKTKLRGAPSRFLKLIEKNEYGRGQFTHAFWVDKIFGYLKERGLDPIKEYKIDDKVADIAYSKNGELVLVEVEYKSDWKGNIVRAAKICDKLVSVFVRERDVLDAINFLKKHPLPNVIVTDAYYFDKVIS